MWLSRKPPAGPTPEELAVQQEAERREAAEAELRRKITAALQKDPAFQVQTVDGTSWICPYTLTVLPAAFGYLEPAREYLFEQRPFKTAKVKTVEEVRRHRWLLYLRANIEFESRLRITGADQRWLNPFTATWAKLPVRPGSPVLEALDAMAAVLAASPEAQDGRAMLDLTVLREAEERLLREQSSHPATDAAAIGASKRVSGRAKEIGPGQASAGDDMGRAKGILERMLAEMPEIPGFGVSVHYEPHNEVGGDFFACLALGPGRWLVTVADVAGHGVQGAFVVVAALKALRFIVRETQDLVEILGQLNDSLKTDLLQGQFVTCWMGVLHAESRRLEMVCAGHHAVAIANPRHDRLLRRVLAKGPAIGLLPGPVFREALAPVTIELEPGDILMQCTDGLLEASDPNRVEFGELRAAGSLLAHSEAGFADVVDRIAADARRFAAGTFADDVTVLALQCDPPQSGPAAEPGDAV